MPDKTSRKQQADKTRASLIMALIQLLGTKEIHEITVREIAKTAGVSTGAFYLHFPSKEAALLYVYRDLDSVFTGLALNGTPRENLQALLASYLNLAKPDSLPLLRKVYTAHLLHYDEYFFSEERPLFQLMQAQLAALRPGEDAAKLTWKLLDYCRGCLYNLCIKPSPPDFEEWRGEVMLDGMGLVGCVAEGSTKLPKRKS